MTTKRCTHCGAYAWFEQVTRLPMMCAFCWRPLFGDDAGSERPPVIRLG